MIFIDLYVYFHIVLLIGNILFINLFVQDMHFIHFIIVFALEICLRMGYNENTIGVISTKLY